MGSSLWTQHVRFEWLADAGQPVLDLAGLFPDLVEGTGVVGGIVTSL